MNNTHPMLTITQPRQPDQIITLNECIAVIQKIVRARIHIDKRHSLARVVARFFSSSLCGDYKITNQKQYLALQTVVDCYLTLS